MNEQLAKALEDIHSTAFAAMNQIAYWKKRGDRGDIESLKAAFEIILKLCEEQSNIEDEEEANQ
jgi:hypothetical protein